MLEILTASSAVITVDESKVDRAALDAAVHMLGGPAISVPVDPSRTTVLQIMDQNVAGSTFTARNGRVFRLDPTDPNWAHDIDPAEIVSATMPGGWTWVKP